MNAPDRLDSIKSPNANKIVKTDDEKMENAANYRIFREDHTLGHALAIELARDSSVLYSSYAHQHPLENDIVMKVQGRPGRNPTEALKDSASRLNDELKHIFTEFKNEINSKERENNML